MQTLLEFLDPQQLVEMIVSYAPKLASGIGLLVVAWAFLKITQPPLRAALRRAEFAETLIRLLVSDVYRFVVMGFGLVMGASQLGIDVGAALAGIGVVGVAVGFAAQESVANTIAGFLIFWDKPFQVGHFVTTEGRYGEVVNITMRSTRIRTPQHTYVVIPNKQIIGNALVNHSLFGEMRVNVPLGIAYKEDIREARRVLLEAVRNLDGVVSQPEPAVVATELGDSSVNLEVWVWVADAAQELPVLFRTIEACKLALDAAGIQIPFPHLQLFVDDVEPRVWDGVGRLVGGAAG